MIADNLGLPSRVVPVVTLTVGYPAADAEISDRIPVEGIMHTERYEDYDTARINALYHEKEQREDSKQFIAENNKETLAQVFTDVRYTRDANEHFSEVLSEFIKKTRILNHLQRTTKRGGRRRPPLFYRDERRLLLDNSHGGVNTRAVTFRK